MRRIVLGLDGSDGATTALRWSVHEAAVHDASLTALYAWSLIGQPATFDPTFDREAALGALRAWIDTVPTDRVVEPAVVCDLPASALIEASAQSDLVVVGSRGLGGFKELLLGSVSSVVAERALCPVAVIRETAAHPLGPIVVGIDGSVHAQKSLTWAVEEARARGVPLEVVHAWSGAPSPVLGLATLTLRDDLAAAAEHAVTDALATLDLRGVVVHRHVPENTAAGALVELSATAALVVVGSRGRGGVTSILLGSTSRHLLHHSRCPVVVVR